MKNTFILIISFTLINYSYEQKLSWPIGYNDVSNKSFLLEYKDGIFSCDTNNDIKLSFEATVAAIIDSSTGKPIIYTNGCDIYNSSGSIINNGGEINPGELSNEVCASYGYLLEHSITIINFPGHSKRYLLLYQKAEDINSNYYKITEMQYSVIDLTRGESNAELTSKNNLIEKGDLIPFAFTKHANGRDYWLITGQRLTNQYSIYLIDSLGINFYNKQAVGIDFEIKKCNLNQRLLCSPDGSICARNTRCGILFFEFDRCTGFLHERNFLPYQFTEIPSSDIAFSLNSNYLFVSNWDEIMRITIPELGVSNQPFIIKNIGTTSVVHLMQLMPNGTILINSPNSEKYLHLIVNTEEKIDFSYLPNSIPLPFNCMRSMPYQLIKDPGRLILSPCDSITSTFNSNLKEAIFKVYPNPASSYLKILTPPGIKIIELALYNYQGIIIQPKVIYTDANLIDVSEIPQGSFYLGIKTREQISYLKWVKL